MLWHYVPEYPVLKYLQISVDQYIIDYCFDLITKVSGKCKAGKDTLVVSTKFFQMKAAFEGSS